MCAWVLEGEITCLSWELEGLLACIKLKGYDLQPVSQIVQWWTATVLLLDVCSVSASRWRGNPTNPEEAEARWGRQWVEWGSKEAGAFSAPRRAPAQYTLYHGSVRADQSSFPTPLAVTEALLPLCQLSGDTDRIFPWESAEAAHLTQSDKKISPCLGMSPPLQFLRVFLKKKIYLFFCACRLVD